MSTELWDALTVRLLVGGSMLLSTGVVTWLWSLWVPVLGTAGAVMAGLGGAAFVAGCVGAWVTINRAQEDLQPVQVLTDEERQARMDGWL